MDQELRVGRPERPERIPVVREQVTRPTRQDLQTAPVDTTPVTPQGPEIQKEKPFDISENFGWLTNMPKSLFNFTKQIVYDLPKDVLTAAVTYGKDPAQYAKDLNLVFSKNNGIGRMLKEGMVDYYANDFWHNFNEDPAHFLGDLAAVASFGGGTVAKAGELGKLASVARVGAKVAKFGEVIDPIVNVSKAAGMAAKPILESLGYHKWMPEFGGIRANRAAGQALDMNAEIIKQVSSDLSPEENALFHRLVRYGDKNEINAALLSDSEGAKRYKIYREAITGGDEKLLKDHYHAITTEEMRDAEAIKMADYSQVHHKEHGLERPITKNEARAMIDAGTHEPTYLATYRMKAQNADLWEIVNKAEYRGGAYSRFEQKHLGGPPPIEDMNKILARQIASKHDMIYKVRLLDDIFAFLREKDAIQFIAKGDTKTLIKKGYAPVQKALLEKYWRDFGKGSHYAAEELKKVVGEFATPERVNEAYAKARALTEADADIAKPFTSEGELYVPKGVAAWIHRELAPISPLGKMFDTNLARFKGILTVMNPKFWPSVIFGNSILGIVYGVSPDLARIVYKNRHFLPAELRDLSRAEYFMAQHGVYSRVANRLGEFAQTLDNIFRLPMYANELGKISEVRMRFAGGNFFMTRDQVVNALQHYGQAPERWSALVDQQRSLHDSIAINLAKTDRKYAQLQRNTKRMEDELGHLMGLKQASLQELSAGLEARKDKLAKMMSGIGAEGTNQGQMAENLKIEMRSKASAIRDNASIEELRVIEKRINDIKSILGQAKLHHTSSTHVENFMKELKNLIVNLRKNPELIDPARVMQSIDAAIGVVEKGRPDLLRNIVKHMKAAVNGRSPLLQRESRLSVLQDMVGAGEERLKELVAKQVEHLNASGQMDRLLPDLARDRMISEKAIEAGNRFFGSYLRLPAFERKTLRRILPFYTFNKAMTMLAFQFPFLYPKRAFIGAHLAQAWNDMMSDEDSYMPARLRDYVPVAAMKDGGVVAISAGYMNPLSSAKVGNIAGVSIPNVFNPLKANPVIALVLKMNGAIPEWSAKPLSPGEYATRLDNGTVVKWTGKGFQTVIAQPTLMKSIMDMFPQSQLIDRMFHRYAQTDRGYLFNPEPIPNPDGSPRYPREILDTILGSIIPTQTYNRDEMKAQEIGRMNAVIKSYIKDLRFAPPVQREKILEVLRGWSIEKNRRWVQ